MLVISLLNYVSSLSCQHWTTICGVEKKGKLKQTGTWNLTEFSHFNLQKSLLYKIYFIPFHFKKLSFLLLIEFNSSL